MLLSFMISNGYAIGGGLVAIAIVFTGLLIYLIKSGR